jgi:4-amino-4-deoxy-L-arabinose transferase-like glycosyltransferase
VVAVVLLAGVIRFWNFTSLGYAHWDEYYFLRGADIFSQSWPKGLGQQSSVTLPLITFTDGTLSHFFGTNSWMPLAVSATYGTLSALALYFLGSRMYGTAVGLVAAAVLATAEFSVQFSRMALADATFGFWIIASVMAIWLAFTRKRVGYWVLAGVATGFALNTKYTGPFPLILAVTWVAVELIVELVKRRHESVSKALRAYLPTAIGVAVMIVVAVLMFAPWVYKLHNNPGFHTFLVSETRFSHEGTPLNFIFWYYWLFASPPTVLLAGVGLVVGLIRFTRADRFMLIYTAGWFAALTLFDAYPREALSVLPALGIWAGRAVVEVWGLLRTYRPRIPWAGTAAAAACVAAILVGQIVALPSLLSLRTLGYADAGAIAARYQSAGSTILVRAQNSAFIYLNKDAIVLRGIPPVVQVLNEKRSSVVFMTDLTLGAFAPIKDFFTLNHARLVVIQRVPNPLYPEVFLQPATTDKLLHFGDVPDEYKYITFWRATAPLQYPPSWRQHWGPP